MAIKRMFTIMREAREQFVSEIVTAGLNQSESQEHALIDKMAKLVEEHVNGHEYPGYGVLGAFRVCYATLEALAQEIDKIIDDFESKGGAASKGGLLH